MQRERIDWQIVNVNEIADIEKCQELIFLAKEDLYYLDETIQRRELEIEKPDDKLLRTKHARNKIDVVRDRLIVRLEKLKEYRDQFIYEYFIEIVKESVDPSTYYDWWNEARKRFNKNEKK